MEAREREVIVLCPVRNAVMDLRRALPVWSTFAHHIILADQGSVDGTRELAAKFPKVRVVHNDGSDYNEEYRSRILVNAAREISDSAVLFCLDADEIPSANIRRSPEWRHFLSLDPGTAGALPWVHLWRTPFQYIARGPGGLVPARFLFIDDGRPFKPMGKIHAFRGVGLDKPDRIFQFNDVVVLHYSLLDFESLAMKNHFYKSQYLVNGSLQYALSNQNHSWFYRVTQDQLELVRSEWLDGWTQAGYDVTSVSRQMLNWHAIEILRWMREIGVRPFHHLDIWNVNWEHYRRIAVEAGIPGIPAEPIKPPSRIRRVCHDILSGRSNARDKLRRVWRRTLWRLVS